MYVCMYVCMLACMHACMYVRTYVCMFVCMCLTVVCLGDQQWSTCFSSPRDGWLQEPDVVTVPVSQQATGREAWSMQYALAFLSSNMAIDNALTLIWMVWLPCCDQTWLAGKWLICPDDFLARNLHAVKGDFPAMFDGTREYPWSFGSLTETGDSWHCQSGYILYIYIFFSKEYLYIYFFYII